MSRMAFFFFSVFLVSTFSAAQVFSEEPLNIGFYKESCPIAEKVVYQVVEKSLRTNPGLGAGLIRLHFHDCFVRGCDASILIDSADGNSTEKDIFINKSLRGFEVIDEAKEVLEDLCPNTVSCADILAFAARDATKILGGIHYELPSGRRDGLVSLIAEPLEYLPAPDSSLEELEEMFAAKGLSVEDLVILSGAHSLGVSHCRSFEIRLYAFNQSTPQDPSIDPNYADVLKAVCPPPPQNTTNITLPMDFVTPHKLDGVYYNNVRKHRVLFRSDQALMDGPNTKMLVNHYAAHGGEWKKDYTEAMVRMGGISVMVGDEGEVRSKCRSINKR